MVPPTGLMIVAFCEKERFVYKIAKAGKTTWLIAFGIENSDIKGVYLNTKDTKEEYYQTSLFNKLAFKGLKTLKIELTLRVCLILSGSFKHVNRGSGRPPKEKEK